MRSINTVDHLTDIHTASEKCQQEKRKTVNGEDILFAMTSLGFENYAEALKIYLSKYREVCSSSPVPTHADHRQTQSTRAETQPRPTSSGGYPAGGPVGGQTSSDVTGQDSMPTLDAQDNGAYGYPPGVGVTSAHNGIGGDAY